MTAVYKYEVHFNPESSPPVWLEPIEPTPPFPADGLPVTEPLALFTFTLASEAVAAGAHFLTYPLQWFTGTGTSLTPDDPPPNFQVQSFSNTYFSVWDFNSSPNRLTHTFYIIIFSGGSLYWGDPVIINEPPLPTGG